MPEFRTPKGTRDILPPESARWEALVARFARTVEAAGYGLVLSPMFENVEVFQRVGESTDVVRKEMYQFTDKGGRELALRPEGTASIVRAFVQHRPADARGRPGTPPPASATSRPRRAATASTIKGASRCWAPRTPTSTSRSSPWRGSSSPGSGCAGLS